MFQPSHFQKMAKHLGIDSLSYEKEYNGFMAKLKNFHESKGTPFRRLPWLGGQYLDLYLLYRKVTSAGGWVKVTEGKMWRDIAEVFNLPPTCTNAAFALRQHYSRYLEKFERINFFGEDAEDVLTVGRPHTPVGVGTFQAHTPSITKADFVSVISSTKDPSRNFDKLVLSLQCGMPNEVDFAINICMLLSNVSNSVFNLSKAPAVVDMLLAHIGVVSQELHGLKELHEQWYLQQDMDRDFIQFWKESISEDEVQKILTGSEEKDLTSGETLFHPARRKAGARAAECQRISQVGMIIHNFSFDDTNASVLASHPLCLRFLVLCICSDYGFLQRMAWGTLSNLSEKMILEPIESSTTQMFLQMLHFFLDHKDRYHVVNAMSVLGKLCTLEGNDEIFEAGLELEAYHSLIKVLIVNDVQLVLSSLESLYNLSGIGQVTSQHIAEVHCSIDILVCLMAMDAESFGPEALSEVQIYEKRIPVSHSSTSKPQPTPVPVAQQQPKETGVQQQLPRPSSPSPGPAPSPSPNPAPIKTTGSEIDPEAFTYKWLQGTYEISSGGSVSRIDIYADYLSSCSKLARVGILNATAFNRIIKLAFPDGQLRRVTSGVNVQYVLAGIKRRANPLPVKSRTDSPPVSNQPDASSPHPPLHKVSSNQQSGTTNSTLPDGNQVSPAWNSPRQQLPPASLQMPFDQRSAQVPGVSQQQQQPPQPSAIRQVLRRPGFSNEGTIQPTYNQEMRQVTADAVRQQSLSSVDPRQMVGRQVKRTAFASDKGQPLKGFPLVQQPSIDGVNLVTNQNPHSFGHQNPSQPSKRVPLTPQIVELPREKLQQQSAYPVEGGQQMPQTVPLPPDQRVAPQLSSAGMIPSQISKSPLPPQRPIQPSLAQPSQTPPPTGFLPRATTPPRTGFVPRGTTPVETKLYQSTAIYRQPAPAYSQQQNQRPAPPAYSSRSAYHSSYPPLAPKPAPGATVQLAQARNHVPSGSTVLGGRYPSSSLAPRSPMLRQNSQPQTLPNIPPSTLQSPSVASGQLNASSQHVLPGGFATKSIRPKVAQDIRQPRKDPLKGPIPEGIVLIAQEERAADVVSGGLIEGSEEQKIIVIENKNRTEISAKGKAANHSTSRLAQDITIGQDSLGEICTSHMDENVRKPLGRLPSVGQRDLTIHSATTVLPASNGNLKRELCMHTVLDSSVENENCQKDMDACGPVKRPRLDKRMSSLESELDNSSTPSRTVSPTPLVNGDIKGDVRNKLVDRILDRDLHLPLNGVCGIDTSDLDLLASDGERLSSSKASSPDLFGSETNSDFGKYLEESDTDTGLFSDILQGDLRIDPIENGAEGAYPLTSRGRATSTGPSNDCGGVQNDKRIVSGFTEQQAKVPISPSIRPEPQRPTEGALPNQYNPGLSRNPGAVNVSWNSTNTVIHGPKAGYEHQKTATGIQQRMPEYLQHGNQAINWTNVENKSGVDPQGPAVQKPVFQHQSIALNPQQGISVQGSSPIHLPGLQQTIVPGSRISGAVNNTVSVTRGSGAQLPSAAPPPYPGGQQTPAIQTSLTRVNADVSRDMQAASWSQNGVQQKQVLLSQQADPRVHSLHQKEACISGFQDGLQHNSVQGSKVLSGPQSASGWQAQYPNLGTNSSPNPDAALCNSTSVPQGRQPSATMPPQYQSPSVPPVGKTAVPTPVPQVGSLELAPTSRNENPADATVPQVVSFRPYRCRWASCYSSFDTSKSLFSHVVNEHVPRDSLVMACMWEGCPHVRRSRSSLLFHLQQKHSEPSPVPSAVPPQQPPAQQQPPPPPQAPVSNPPSSYVPAYHFLARMLQSMQGEEESPLTKSVRLTAALVLRNLAQYSSLARSMLKRHERKLSLVAMSNSEAAHAIAACLSELSPHRKSSSNDMDSFVWAINR